jgi:hypothetical protein
MLPILYKFFDLCIFCCCKKVVKNLFKEKVYFTEPYIFASFRNITIKKNKKLYKKNLFLAITFESLDQKFSKSGI